MTNELTLLIMGGDQRQIEVAKMGVEKGIDVKVVGFDQMSEEWLEPLKTGIDSIDFRQVDAILLPVSGVGAEGKIETIYSEDKLTLSKEILEKTPEHCSIYTGISTPYLDQVAQEANKKIVRIFARDDVAILNSIPTAEGTLKLAIEHTDFMIHGSKTMVLGYGRVGKTMARMFAAVGADVRVGARKDADFARITETGLTPFHLQDLETEIAHVDLCINTIPHLVLTPSVIANMPKQSLIIDVASKPGGTDFDFAKEKGIKTLWALGLPGKFAPKSAGEIIGKVLFELLKKQTNGSSTSN